MDASKALVLNPKFSEAYVLRGRIYLEAKMYQKGLEDFDKAVELNPQLASAYLNRGAIKVAQRKYQEGLNDLKKGVELLPALEPEARPWIQHAKSNLEKKQ